MKRALRKDTTCLNCGNTVLERYCGVCGQENIESRQSFGGLLFHFIEDLTHYEGKFWQTIKYLLSRPSFLTKQYLQGKRMQYLPPVRLYIFVSFITFFMPYLLVSPAVNEDASIEEASIDSIPEEDGNDLVFTSDKGLVASSSFRTQNELILAYMKLEGTDSAMSVAEYIRHKRAIELRKYSSFELSSLFWKAVTNNFPKTLILYLPLFALVLLLFHRNGWYYFDHAIFTLHYLSFMLLVLTLYNIVYNLLSWANLWFESDFWIYLQLTLFLVVLCWFLYYFYRAHFQFYKQQLVVSLTKGTVVLVFNIVLFLMLFSALMVISFLTVH
jgi:hypothetical protein